METDTLDLPSLARYLNRDVRDLEKLASKGKLPGRRIAGRWMVHRSEVHHWLERGASAFDDRQLVEMERSFGALHSTAVVAPLMKPERVSLNLPGKTAPGVLSDLVKLANDHWQVYDPDRILMAVREREASAPTTFVGRVAIPHPARRQPDYLSESIVAFGKVPSGVPFGDPDGKLTDLFFLLLSRDDATHLRVLARLVRLFNVDGFLDSLRSVETQAEVVETVLAAEGEV